MARKAIYQNQPAVRRSIFDHQIACEMRPVKGAMKRFLHSVKQRSMHLP